MRARAPLDVDLEDKLLYGLTPTRLAYVVLALLGGFALWSSTWGPSPLRAVVCALVIGVGALAGWGRWRGRAVDSWVWDVSMFVINTHRLSLDKRWARHLERRQGSAPPPPQAGPIEILVTGRAPRAGASTVATELVACLVAGGQIERRWTVSQEPAGCEHKPSASSFLLSVAAVDGGRVCYLDRGAGPLVVGLIPEDECVRQAAALNLATVVAFPDSPAGRAYRELAEVIASRDS